MEPPSRGALKARVEVALRFIDEVEAWAQGVGQTGVRPLHPSGLELPSGGRELTLQKQPMRGSGERDVTQ
jgi:hypothetical protein